MFEKLKQYKDLRDQAKKLQSQLGDEQVRVDHRGIALVMNGNQEVVSLEIQPERLTPDEKQALERDLKEAMNDAVKKVQNLMAAKFRSGGYNLPGFS